MRKSLLFAWLSVLITFSIGSIYMPEHILFYMTSNDTILHIARLTTGFMLGLQIITKPPRHMALRFLSGFYSVALLSWVAQGFLSFDIQLFDAVSLVGSALAMGITALEIDPDAQTSYSFSDRAVSQ